MREEYASPYSPELYEEKKIKEAESDRYDYNTIKIEKLPVDIRKKIEGIKEHAEANIIGCIYRNPNLLYIKDVSRDLFTDNRYGMLFSIAHDIVINENLKLTQNEIERYCQIHDTVRDRYNRLGGYKKVLLIRDECCSEDSFDHYLEELNKWNAIIKIMLDGFLFTPKKIDEFAKISAEKVYTDFTLSVNNNFGIIGSAAKSYDVFEAGALQELIDETNDQKNCGRDFGNFKTPEMNDEDEPIKVCPLLNDITNGFRTNGHIYGLGAASGVGKSNLAIQLILPLCIYYNKPAIFFINEEDQKKFQQEALTWVINNVLYNHPTFNKKRFLTGHYTKKENELLTEAANYLDKINKKSIKDNNGCPLIKVIPLEKYSCRNVINLMRKYKMIYNVDMFVLDTLKESWDTPRGVETWKAMERDMVEFYNAIKSVNLNVGLFVTYQLGKQAIKLRHLSNMEIGQAKNIVDVMSVNLMMRRPWRDECQGGKKELKVLSLQKALDAAKKLSETSEEITDCEDKSGGIGLTDKQIEEIIKNNEEKAEGKLDDNDPDGFRSIDDPSKFSILFIAKNRFGEYGSKEIVAELDQGYNTYREYGITHVEQDFSAT